MMNKPFLIFIFSLLMFQVVFSFYYSSEIINQNNFINKNQITLESKKTENQELKKQLATLTSLNQISSVSGQKNYINLKKYLDIQN